MRWAIDVVKSLSGWLCCIEIDTIQVVGKYVDVMVYSLCVG